MRGLFRLRGVQVAIVLIAICSITTYLTVAGWSGFPVPPEPPPPPDWLNRFAADIVLWLAPKLYWDLFFTFLVFWGILNWQKLIGESPAARWNRRLYFAMWSLWLTLAVGRTVFQEWLTVGYALVVILIAIIANGAMIAAVVTYVVPLIRCRNGRCEVIAPPVDGVLLPDPLVYRGPERRSGKERRKNWKATN